MDNELENLPFAKYGLYIDKQEFLKKEQEKKALIQASCEKKTYYEDSPNPNERPDYVPDERQPEPHPN